MTAFTPSGKWQDIPDGAILPPGCQIEVDVTTGRKRARKLCLEPDLSILAIAELAQRKQWVCWRAEQRGDKVTKVPITPAGHNASSTDPKTWSSFDACCKAVEAGKADGIGYVFAEGDNCAGFDLDHVIQPDGTVLDWALAVVRMVRSYTEVSPSGTGLHLIVRTDQDLPKGFKRVKHGGASIEGYSWGRFFCITGQTFLHPTIKHDTGQLADVDLTTLVEHPLFVAANGTAGKKAPNGNGQTRGSVGLDGKLRITAEDIDVKVSPRRGIGAGDLMDILDTLPDFRSIWGKKGKPANDATHSGYMASIARRLRDIGKDDQFIADALVEFCRQHKRMDKVTEQGGREVRRSIALAHTHETARSPTIASKLLEEAAKDDAAQERFEVCRDDRGEALKELSAHFNVEIEDVKRKGESPGRLLFKVAGRWYDIGTPTQVYNQITVLYALNHYKLASVMRSKEPKWMRISSLIVFHAARFEDAEDEEEAARIEEWVIGMSHKELDLDKSMKWRKSRLSHVYDGWLIVFPNAEGLDHKSLALNRSIYTVLAEAGFRPHRMSIPGNSKNDVRRVWRRAVEPAAKQIGKLSW